MIHKLLYIFFIMIASFENIGIGDTSYIDIHGNREIKTIERDAKTINIMYFDTADDNTSFTETESVKTRLKVLAESFADWKDYVTVMVVTPSNSLIANQIRNMLPTNQDICVNRSDELWKQYHHGLFLLL